MNRDMSKAPRAGCLVLIPQQHPLVPTGPTWVAARWDAFQEAWVPTWGYALLPRPVAWAPFPAIEGGMEKAA